MSGLETGAADSGHVVTITQDCWGSTAGNFRPECSCGWDAAGTFTGMEAADITSARHLSSAS